MPVWLKPDISHGVMRQACLAAIHAVILVSGWVSWYNVDGMDG
jgi:hypothetical protein